MGSFSRPLPTARERNSDTMKVKTLGRVAIMALVGLCCVFISYQYSKRKTEVFLSPLRDLLSHISSSFFILGTDRKSPSFCFLYRPNWTDSHYANFYVETSMFGSIKSFSGPFFQGNHYCFYNIRSNLIETAKIETARRNNTAADRKP